MFNEHFKTEYIYIYIPLKINNQKSFDKAKELLAKCKHEIRKKSRAERRVNYDTKVVEYY